VSTTTATTAPVPFDNTSPKSATSGCKKSQSTVKTAGKECRVQMNVKITWGDYTYLSFFQNIGSQDLQPGRMSIYELYPRARRLTVRFTRVENVVAQWNKVH
jgi:hypothetical protein